MEKHRVSCNDCGSKFTEIYPEGLNGSESYSDPNDPKTCNCISHYTILEEASPRCPKCDSENIFYVQRVFEYHYMKSFPYEDGFVDFVCMDDSVVDDEFPPYLLCDSCDNKFDLQLNEKGRGFSMDNDKEKFISFGRTIEREFRELPLNTVGRVHKIIELCFDVGFSVQDLKNLFDEEIKKNSSKNVDR